MIRARALLFSAAVVSAVTWFVACNPSITGAPCPNGQQECPTGQVCTPQGTCEVPPGSGGGAGGSGGAAGGGSGGGTGGGSGGGVGGGSGGGAGGGTGGAGGGSSKKADGQPCQGPLDCQSNACNDYYQDSDNDGHGKPPSAKICGFPAPAGWATNSDDCCDADNKVFPGQTQYFGTPRNSVCMGGANPFDYDCNMQADPEPLTLMNCQPPPPGCNTCAAGLGWAKPDRPDCGVTEDQVVALGTPDTGIDDAGCRYMGNMIQPVQARCR